MQFYVLFAILARHIERRPLATYAAFIGISVAYRVALRYFGTDNDFGWVNQLPAVLDVFGAGLFAAFAFVQLRAEAGRRRNVAVGCALSAVVVIALGLHGASLAQAGGSDGVLRWLNAWRVAFGPVLMLLALGVAFGSPALRYVAGLPALAWLSLVSYNAYLWNLEIAVGLQGAGAPGWIVFWLGALLTLTIAAGLTYCFERPLQRGGFRMARQLVAPYRPRNLSRQPLRR